MKLEELFKTKSPAPKPIRTRFRAYKLSTAGSLCSYFAGDHFTLIEAMDTDASRSNLLKEMEICGKQSVDTLHITSWDDDHCEAKALEWILKNLKPTRIEHPGYTHHTQCAKDCAELISSYKRERLKAGRTAKVIPVTPDFIAGLETASALGYTNIFYHPKTIHEKSNNNSTVKFFRTGVFNVLSTGDIEHHDIGSYLRSCKKLCRELDVLILPHHGGPVDLMTEKFLDELRPSIAVCTSNSGNQHEHPDESVVKLLSNKKIPLMTTRRGDVVIESINGHINKFEAIDFLSNGKDIQKSCVFTARKFDLLSKNADTIRDRLNHQNTGPSRNR